MTALLVTAALMADLLTATPTRETNPLAAAILASGLGLAAKAAEAALVLAVVAIVRGSRPALAVLVSAIAIGAGTIGAWSNL